MKLYRNTWMRTQSTRNWYPASQHLEQIRTTANGHFMSHSEPKNPHSGSTTFSEMLDIIIFYRGRWCGGGRLCPSGDTTIQGAPPTSHGRETHNSRISAATHCCRTPPPASGGAAGQMCRTWTGKDDGR
jgi:hypothetical protein